MSQTEGALSVLVLVPCLAVALSLTLASCGRDNASSRGCGAPRDALVTGAVHPFDVRYGGHCAGIYRNLISPRLFVSRDAALYFQGTTDGQDAGVWTSDGTFAGTRPVASYAAYSENAPYAVFLREILPLDGGLLLARRPVCNYNYSWAPLPRPLWWVDAQGVTPIPLEDRDVEALVEGADGLFLAAEGKGHSDIWHMSPTTRTPVALRSFTFRGVAHLVARTGGGAFFRAREQGSVPRAWFSDGTPGGTLAVTPVAVDCGYVESDAMATAGGRAFLACGHALWMSDGTAAGTSVVPGVPSAQSATFRSLTNLNGKLLFFYWPETTQPAVELWRTDGTSAGTQRLAAFSIPYSSTTPTGSPLLVVGSALYFFVEDTLWRSDGTPAGTVRVTPVAAAPRLMAELGGTLFVVAGDKALWRVDGGEAAQVAIDESVQGVESIEALAATPTRLFYAALPAGAGFDRLLMLRTLTCTP